MKGFVNNYYEVDFILKNKDNTLSCINVSWTDEIPEREERALIEVKKKFSKIKETLILTKDTEKNEEEMKYVPLWKWMLEEN